MEFVEICQQKFNMIFHHSFSLTSCWPNENKYALMGANYAIFLTLRSTTSSQSDNLNIDWSRIQCSSQASSTSLLENINMEFIYRKSTILERQIISLDRHYSNEYCRNKYEPFCVCVSWPSSKQIKFKDEKDSILAVVNGLGICEIMLKDVVTKQYEIAKICINDHLKDVFNTTVSINTQSFNDIKTDVENFSITYCCWKDPFSEITYDPAQLICSTMSGWILAFNIDIDWNITYAFKIQTNLKLIRNLKSFAFKHSNDCKPTTFLFAADANGILKLYKHSETNFKEIITLWDTADKMICKTIEISYHENINKLSVAVVKGAHFLVFLLSPNGQICSKIHHYSGGISIIGLQPLNAFEYISCTIDGYIEHIQISYEHENLSIKSSDSVKHNLSNDNNDILGMSATSNKVGWLFIVVENKLTIENAGYLSVCRTNKIDPLDIIINCKDFSMLNYLDCLEIIRLNATNLKTLEDINTNLELKLRVKPQSLDEFLHILKIKRVITNGINLNNRLKPQHKEKITEDSESIDDAILALYSYNRLKYLMNLSYLSATQKLSGKLMKITLLNYLENTNLPEDYCEMKQQLVLTFNELLLEEKLNIFDDAKYDEKCVYCLSKINFDSKLCENNHNLPSCCITLRKITSMFSRRYCPRCSKPALDDDSLLYEILGENTSLECPYCAFPFVLSDN